MTGGADWATSTLFNSTIKVRALSAMPRAIYTRPLSTSVDLEVGANADAQTFATVVPAFQSKQSDLGRSRQALSQAAYATVMIHAGDRLVISPGLRADLFAEEGTQALFVEPRLDVLFKLSDTLSLRADGGRYAQMPSLPVSVPGFEAFGLADLGAQTSLGGSLGVEARLPGHLTLGVTGYYQKLRVSDVRNIDIEQNDPTAPDFLVARDGRAYGAELLLRRADTGRLLRLAGLHALLESALRRQRRARPLRLGRAAHPEPRRRLAGSGAATPSARASISTPGAGRRSSTAGASTSSSRPTTRSTCAPSAASSSIAS